MMHKAWSSVEEVPYCFSRSSIKFPDFNPNLEFPLFQLKFEFTDGFEIMDKA